jgi:hypothetical protein
MCHTGEKNIIELEKWETKFSVPGQADRDERTSSGVQPEFKLSKD